jgi:hypothetical protein
MSNKNMALSSNALLVLGIFCPIVSIPFMGAQNYFQNGKGDGMILLVLASISFLLISKGWFRLVYLTGSLSLLVPVYTLLTLIVRLHSISNSMKEGLKDNPFSGFAEVALQSIQIQWGWILLIGGSVCLLVAAWRAVREQQSAVLLPVGPSA